MELKVYMIDVSHSVVQSSVHGAFHLAHSVPLSESSLEHQILNIKSSQGTSDRQTSREDSTTTASRPEWSESQLMTWQPATSIQVTGLRLRIIRGRPVVRQEEVPAVSILIFSWSLSPSPLLSGPWLQSLLVCRNFSSLVIRVSSFNSSTMLTFNMLDGRTLFFLNKPFLWTGVFRLSSWNWIKVLT